MNSPSQNKKTAVFGATGLVGSELVQQLAKMTGASTTSSGEAIIAFVRKEHSMGPHVKVVVTDVGQSDLKELKECSDVFYALGTTLKRAGTKEAFRAVDYDLALHVAKRAKEQGCQRFFLVSSQGANAKSRVFYLKTKGELEKALEELNFEALVVARPSLLLGDRAQSRPAETLSKKLTALFPWSVLPGPIKAYQPIAGAAVARALINIRNQNLKKVEILEAEELRRLAGFNFERGRYS